ncbi:MAG TPA: MG2 domain-containing protein, partial [Holophagaceae bacterium]|nr:MG2 domain-containing protein [Holophagaceae bacterium]
MTSRTSSRLLRAASLALVGLGLLVPQLSSALRRQEAPWVEGGWPRSFAMPRPSLPGEPAVLECSGPVPPEMRVRLHRVKDPAAFLNGLLVNEEGRVDWQAQKAGKDPFDVLREAFLWSGRRTFTTVHRTATRALRDTARETERAQQPMNDAEAPREGQALPLEGRADLSFVKELVPEAPENEPNALRLPAQAPGLYLVEVLLKDEAAYVPWLVTDLALLGEQDGARLRVSALSARDGSPVADAKQTLVSEGKALPLSSDANGDALVNASPGVKRFVWASKGDSFAILSIEGLASATPRQRVYAYTERPLYRPGQEVFVKAIVRSVEKGENVLPKNYPAPSFRVLDPEDTEVAKGQADLLNAGTATYGAKIQLPNGGRLGLYRVIFSGPAAPAQAEFKVEQFVKPAFSVSVTTAQPKVGVGDALKFGIQARYFYGAAVRGAKAEWFLYQVRPSLNWWDDDAGPAPELKESGTLDLDDDGVGTLGGLVAKEEGVWRLVVKVADGSGQRNGGQSQVRCAKGDLVLFLSPDRELVAPGQPFKATVRVLDLDGHEVTGIPVTLKACTIRFTQRGKENGTTMKDDPWAWSYQHRPGEVLSQAQGPEATFTIPKAGLHLLYAEAVDRSGRKIEALRPITVAADNTPLPAVPDMKAASDKREYRVGETAKILVRLPKPNLQLRWSIEGEQLGERGSRKVPGTSAIIEVPITAAMQPNAWAVFEILHDGRRQLVEVPLRAPKVEKKLQVSVVPDKTRYQPGETMKVAVEVKDSEGRPSAADLSVGVVDEAIYALSAELHPDPFRFFHPVRRHLVQRAGSTDWSFYDLLRKARDVRSLKQTARGEFKEEDEKIRKNFKDTAYWQPFVAAGADGRAQVELPLPDNLTAWRATATAVTADTRVGVGRASRPASKPLQVSLTIPRTFTKGEEARAIAMVRNLSGRPIQGKVRLDVKNGSVQGSPEGSFNIPDQGEFRFALPLLSDQLGAMVVTARVEGGGLKDGEQQRVEVVE